MPNGEELWLQELTITSSSEPALLFLGEELQTPRTQAHQAGDQRALALQGAPYAPGNALALAWVDYGRSFGEPEGTPDIAVQLSPVPLNRTQEVNLPLADSLRSGR